MDFAGARFQGEQAQVRLSWDSLVAQSRDQRMLEIPAANIVAIYVRRLEEKKEGLPGQQGRVYARLLILEVVAQEEEKKKKKGLDSNAGDAACYYVFQSFDLEYDAPLASGESVATPPPPPPPPPLLLPRLPDHMLLPSDGGEANVHVVISTLSGTHRADSFFHQALKPLLDELDVSDYNVLRTESPDTISEWTRSTILPRANRQIKQLIILLSGDGGIVDMVNGLLSQRLEHDAAIPTVALIPMGTGNALFHSTCRPRSPLSPTPQSDDHTDDDDNNNDNKNNSLSTPSPDSPENFADQTLGLRPLLHGTPHPLPTFRATFSPGSTTISYPSSSPLKPIRTPLPTPLLQSPSSPPPNPVLYGCVLTSWCLHASLISLSDSPTHRRHGSSRFATAAKTLLSPPDGSPSHIYRGVVSTLHMAENGEKEEVWRVLRDGDGDGDGDSATSEPRRRHRYILATLVSKLEENFTISPQSGRLDGKGLWVVSIGGGVAVEEVGRVLGLAYHGGKHVGVRDGEGRVVVGYERVEGMRIQLEEEDGDEEGDGVGQEEKGLWRRVCVDGVVVEVEVGGWVEVRMNRKGSKGRKGVGGDGDGGGSGEVVRIVC